MASFHVRSISLPKTSHPLTLAVEEQLCKLKATEQATSSSSIYQNLSGLTDLYECVEDFLATQDGKCLDSGLDGSIILLDVCSIAKDVLSQMKQSVQELQSSIRRRSNEVSDYMISRKKTSKVIRKCLSDLKNNKKIDTEVTILREVEVTTLAVLESVLSFVSEPKQKNSLISKLMPTKQVSNEETSEVMKVDIAVKALTKGIEVNNVQKTLKALEMTLEDLEDKLEAVFRCLIKTRVSLLNSLNHLPRNFHPLTIAVEEQLCQLRTTEQATSSSSICKNLTDGECLVSVLDGSIMVLDVCSIPKDVLSQMKQFVQELQSSIRRRSNEASEYMISRKKITKVIRKCLYDLKNKKIDSECSILREVEATTLVILESLLSFMSEPKQNKSLISKLILNKRVAHKCDEETS
ncbi:hypothetical protein MKW98_007205 [Papaver atlanticum]|uniref:Uncharacterized protein n=1 Tax=Papaver atlanticum TaxID=357466 RepID=A0AAD4SN88_9MAGN|nr:hypothetical protein MKW98_007205 [Papaver atlanticum]